MVAVNDAVPRVWAEQSDGFSDEASLEDTGTARSRRCPAAPDGGTRSGKSPNGGPTP
jgi:hypothetical protein